MNKKNEKDLHLYFRFMFIPVNVSSLFTSSPFFATEKRSPFTARSNLYRK